MTPTLDNVVTVPNFAAQTAKRRASSKSEAAKHPDGELIAGCIKYAVDIAAADIAYKVDPTADSEFAQPRDTQRLSRACKTLEAVTALHPTTLDGLRAKANLVSIIMKDMAFLPLEPFHADFLRTFAAEVIQLHKSAADTSAASLSEPQL